MRWYAEKLGYGGEADFWATVGLLHDLDFEQFPEQHCVKSQELMRKAGVDEATIHATASHGYGITVDVKPEHEMEKVLFAADELTGLIWAAALMRPSKSTKDMELKSLKKKGQEVRGRLLARDHPARRRPARLGAGHASGAHARGHARYGGHGRCGNGGAVRSSARREGRSFMSAWNAGRPRQSRQSALNPVYSTSSCPEVSGQELLLSEERRAFLIPRGVRRPAPDAKGRDPAPRGGCRRRT